MKVNLNYFCLAFIVALGLSVVSMHFNLILGQIVFFVICIVWGIMYQWLDENYHFRTCDY